jgi:hypothetical protein
MVNDEDVQASCGQLYLQKWMNDRSSSILQSPAHHPTDDCELGFVSSFYQECLQLLLQLWKYFQPRLSTTKKRQLQETITRFVLWGSGWSEGRLDFCLDGSVQLRNNVTELLSGLAKALLHGNRWSETCSWRLANADF